LVEIFSYFPPIEMSGWATIESDPGVFSEMMKMFGVKGVEMEEVFSLSEPSLLPQYHKILV
jgi:hypothetical protein